MSAASIASRPLDFFRHFSRTLPFHVPRAPIFFVLAFFSFLTLSVASCQPTFAQSSAAPPNISGPQKPTPAAIPADKGRAQKAFQDGRRAEQSADWATAYSNYSEAVTYAPANSEYSRYREHARFQLVQGLTEQAERQLLAGDTPAARNLLQRALNIDPGFTVARERLAELPDEPVHEAPDRGPRFAGPVRVKPQPGVRDFDVRGGTRTAYEELGRQFGVTFVFDGDLVDRALRFRAPKVDFETALMVLERQARTFSRVVDARTMFVMPDTPQKQRDYALEIEKSLILPASTTSDEMNETVRMIREMTGITRTQINTASRTLTIRSSEQNVALAEALLGQIEQARGELMLEVDILEVDRDAAHQLGVTPPTSAQAFSLSAAEVRQLQQAQNNGTLQQILQNIFGSGGALGGSGVNPLAPALIAFGGGRTLYFATLPGARADFGQTLSVIRSARRVMLRAQNGKPATFFVGDRYPISLGLLSASLTPTTTALASGITSGSLPRTDYNTGTGPVAIASGDFNGDNHPDFVVANQTAGTISIFLGSSSRDGTFGNRTDITVGTMPSAVAVRDFNGDGRLDIAVANSGDNDVAILLGNGDGTFAAGVTYPTGNGPTALLSIDIDLDGHADLITANQAAGTISILPGKADGTFGTKIDYAVGAGPVSIASADLNSDGLADLIVSNHTDNTISVLLQKVDNTFAPAVSYATGAGPQGVASADINHDGHPDIAVANATAGTVSIYLGSSTGILSAPTNMNAGSGPFGIQAEDFTGDGVADLVLTDQSRDNLSIFVGAGDGTFSIPISLPTGNSPVALLAADLDSNGTLDVIVANQASNSVTVILNNAISASPSSLQTAYPSSEYIDLGIKVKATPRLHGDDEVTLEMAFDIRSLAGTAINGIPVLSNRTIEQTIRLRENQTSVLSGILHTDEARSLNGWPWTSTIPAAGVITGEHTADMRDTEMLIIVTPRALRLPPHNPEALYAGHGEPVTPPAGPIAPPGPIPGGGPAGVGAPGPLGPGPFSGPGVPPQNQQPNNPANPAPGLPPGTVVNPQQ